MNAANTRVKPETHLAGRRLLVARLVWVVLAAIMVVTFTASLSAYWTRASQVCTAPPAECATLSLLSSGDVQRLQALGLPIVAWAVYNVAQRVISLLVFCAVALVIFIRRPADPMALLASLLLVTWGAANGNLFGVLVASQPTWRLAVGLSRFIAMGGFVLFFCLFPNGAFVPRWTRWTLAAWVPVFILLEFAPGSTPSLLSTTPGLIAGAFFVLIVLVAQVYRYRRVSTPVERQQTKWVVSGIEVLIVGFLVNVFVALSQGPGTSVSWSHMLQDIGTVDLFLLLPITVGIAVLRYHLFDIDVIIRRTVTYGLLTALLLAVYLGGVVVLQRIFVILTGQRQELAIILSTLAIAALSVPLRNRIQAVIDRRFFRAKYDAEKVLAGFSATTRDEVDMSQLTGRLMDVVDETLQPTQVTVWLREHGDYRVKGNRI